MRNKLLNKILISFLFLGAIAYSVKGQNLVNNPGFEINTSNPTNYNQLPLAKGWSNLNGTFGPTNSYGTPDYYSILGCCGLQLPYTGNGTLNANSGNCIMGLGLYDGELTDYREYARTFLTSSLVVGKTYIVSFYTSTADSEQQGEYTSNNLGLLFTVDSTKQKTYEVVNRTPQINITNVVAPKGWQQYLFVFTADSTYKYLTVGNFYDDASTTLAYSFSGTAPYAYYFFDDFSVTPIDVSNDTSICLGSSVNLFAHYFASYSWCTTTDTTVFSMDSIITVTPFVSTNYIISGSGFNDTVHVKVVSTPSLSVSSNQSICGGGSVVLSASGASDYLWSPANGLSCTTCSNPTAAPITTTTYIVTGSDSGCSVSASVLISVLPFISISNDTTICYGTSVQLKAFSDNLITWSPSTGLSATIGDSVIADPLKTTTYTATTDSGGCTSTATSIVNITSKANISILPPSPSICEGNNILISASGIKSYQWSPPSGLNTITGSSVIAGPSVTTTYTVQGKDSSGCAADTAIILIVNPKPAITTDSNTACSGIPAVLKASGTLYYSWSPNYALDKTFGDSVVATPTTTTTYTVIGTNSYGCTDTTYSVLTIFDPPNKPIIMQHGDTLISSAKTDNQWYINDTLISGATGTFLVITREASYTVVIVDPANGCSNVSEPLVTSGINQQLLVAGNKVSVYPNPTYGNIYIKINASAENIVSWKLELTDLLGRVVYIKNALLVTNSIDLFNLPNGVYFVSITSSQGKAVFQVIKQD